MYNNYNSFNSRSLFKTSDNFKLPSFDWQRKTEIKNDFNNELVKGFQSNLTLYSPEQDLKLFNNLDLEPIRSTNVNFDKVNAITQENYNKNDDIYNNAKSTVQGGLDGLLKGTGESINNFISQLFDIKDIKIYGGLILLFILLNRN